MALADTGFKPFKRSTLLTFIFPFFLYRIASQLIHLCSHMMMEGGACEAWSGSTCHVGSAWRTAAWALWLGGGLGGHKLDSREATGNLMT